METQACLDLVDDDESLEAKDLFHVAGDETTFLNDCYQSIDPVILASPFFLLANYIMFPVAVGSVCLLTIVPSGYGDVLPTFYSIRTDKYVMPLGIRKTIVCLMWKVFFSPQIWPWWTSASHSSSLLPTIMKRCASSSSSCSPIGSWCRSSIAM
jgi:hypothetical protein